MINQVVSNNVENKTFSEFLRPQQGWYLAAQNKNNENRRSYKIPLTIGTVTLFTGFGILALLKGPKTVNKYLGKLKNKLEQKLESSENFKNFYGKSLEYITSLYEKSSSVNNITSLKDILFKKIMYSNGITKKIHSSITSAFSKIGRSTVNSSYAKSNKKFASLNEQIILLNKSLENQEIIENVSHKILKFNKNLNDGFGNQARAKRFLKADNETDKLYEYMWNASYGDVKQNFRSKNLYQKFIAEEYMQPFKNSMTKEMSDLKLGLQRDIKDILKEYKKVLPEKEYIKLEAKINSAIKSLKKSIDVEINYVDKLRDLKIGSAPTDVLSIVGALGAAVWFSGKSKDKDERISSTLKYGIPALGAIATSLLCTAKLIAGSKALAFGLMSGWVMNKVGEVVNDARKKYKLDISLENRTIVKPQISQN